MKIKLTMEQNKVEYELDNQTRERMRQKKLGQLNPNFGKPRDEETKRKIAQSQRKRWAQVKTTGKEIEEINENAIEFENGEDAFNFFGGLEKRGYKIIILTERGFARLLCHLRSEIGFG